MTKTKRLMIGLACAVAALELLVWIAYAVDRATT
jgi:hypothetical protein